MLFYDKPTNVASAYAKAMLDERQAFDDHFIAIQRADHAGARTALKNIQRAAEMRVASYHSRDVPEP
jgi:methionine synthase II (cobalamin-independent)